jgi:hypothetical protein
MPDYSTGKIYVIFSTSKKIFYIGSTTQSISQRLGKHNSDFKSYKLGKYNWVSSFDVLECEDYKIELLEEYPCCNRTQLGRREGEHIKTYSKNGFTCVNKNIAGRTIQEYFAVYYEKNKEDILEKVAEYRTTHKEDIKKQIAEYRATHKKAIAEKNAVYYEKNKEDIRKKQTEYRAKNKQAVSADEPEM